MVLRRVRPAVLAVLVLALAACGGGKDDTTTSKAAATPAPPPPTRTPPPDAETKELLPLLAPKGVPTAGHGEKADPAATVVVQRWLKALSDGDIPAAADTFAPNALVQNLRPPVRLRTRALRIAFNETFPCGAELSTASTVKGYLVVTYRLTDRKGSKCDGPGGSAAGTIKVAGGKMTEWYRLPNPPDAGDDAEPGPVV